MKGYILEIISIFAPKKLNPFTVEAFCENSDLVTMVPQDITRAWRPLSRRRPFSSIWCCGLFTFQYTVMVWCLETVTLRVRSTSNILWRCAGVPSLVSLFLDSIVEGSILLKTATLWMTLKSKTVTISLLVSLHVFLLALSLLYFCSLLLPPSSHDHFLCDIYRNSPPLFIKFCDVMASLGSRLCLTAQSGVHLKFDGARTSKYKHHMCGTPLIMNSPWRKSAVMENL